MTIFDKIISGEIPSYKIYEDDKHLAFLDIFPIHIGQVLVIPKKPIDYVFDMEDADYTELLLLSKRLSKKIKKALNPYKVGMVVEGLEVPHVHVKLIPIDYEHTIDPKHIKKADPAQLKEIQDMILAVE